MAPLDPETKYRLLLEISRKISRTLELQDLLDQILDSVRLAIPYDAGGIFVLHESVPLAPGPVVNLIGGMAQVGYDERPRMVNAMLRSGGGIVGHVIRTGESVVAQDVRRDPRYVVARAATRSEIAVPIVSNVQIIGALNLESDRTDAFAETDAEMLQFFAVAAAIAIEKAILHRQVLDKQRIEHQLRIAREVQTSLLPQAAPEVEGYDIAAVNLPTWEIGGDYYDYIPLPNGRLGIVIADVSGKGVPAALIMASFRAALRAELQRGERVVGVFEAINRILLDSSGASRFVTAVYGILDPGRGRFTYVNCGHNPPLLLGSRGGRAALDAGGPALGMVAGVPFVSGEVTLEPGDTLALYTDGVVELSDEHDVEYGLDRLEAQLRAGSRLPAGDTILSVVDSTRAYAGREGYVDDFTLVVIKRDGGTGN